MPTIPRQPREVVCYIKLGFLPARLTTETKRVLMNEDAVDTILTA